MEFCNSDPLGSYSKLLLIDLNETKLLIIDRERQELMAKLDEDRFAPENAFIEEAIQGTMYINIIIKLCGLLYFFA